MLRIPDEFYLYKDKDKSGRHFELEYERLLVVTHKMKYEHEIKIKQIELETSPRFITQNVRLTA